MTATLNQAWPTLPLAEWRDTLATLHMWTQIVGKTQLETRADGESLVAGRAVCDAARAHDVFDSARRTHVRRRLRFYRPCRVGQSERWLERRLALAARSVADFYNEYIAVLPRSAWTSR